MTFMNSIVEKVRREAGGAKKLAILLASRGHQITPQAISQWTQVPAKRALDIAELTGIPLYELRPDIYPEEAA